MRKRRPGSHRRGRTRPGRLRLLHQLLSAGALALPKADRLCAADIGFGDAPVTTRELYQALCAGQEEAVQLWGIDCDPSRVEAAQRQEQASEALWPVYELGGFDHLNQRGIAAHLVTCFNVLRGYPLEFVAEAQRQMLRGIAPGGILVEGSTDVGGDRLTAHLWRRAGPEAHYEGLLLATSFARGFAPRMFRDVLPRDLRRHVKDGEPVCELFTAWQSCVDECARAGDLSLTALFADSAHALAQQRQDVCCKWSGWGALVWTPQRPSYRPLVLAPGRLVA